MQKIVDLETTFVSLVRKGANKKKFAIIKSDSVEFNVDIMKADDEKHIVTGIVYEPLELDSHNQFMDEETIEKTAHTYLEKYRNIDKEHNFDTLENVTVVESWIAKEDGTLNGQEIKKGAWLMSVRVNDNETWSLIKSGEITGFSLAGTGALEEVEVVKNNDVEERNMDKLTAKIEELQAKIVKMEEDKTKEEEVKMLKEEQNKMKEEVEKMETKLAKADELIKSAQLKNNVVQKEISNEDILKCVGEAFSYVAEKGARGSVKLSDVLTQISKSENSIMKSMNTVDTSAAVKDTVIERILEKILAENTIAKYINFITISDNSLLVPVEKSGLIECKWVEETGLRDETTGVTLGNVRIDLHQLYAMPIISNKLLATNFLQLGNFIMGKISQAIQNAISNAVLFGTGNGQPVGIFEDTDVKANMIPVTALDYDIFLEATHSLLSQYEAGSRIFMSKKTWAELIALKDDSGRYLYSLTSSLDRANRTFHGFPVEFNDALPSFSEATSDMPFALFGDINKAMLGAKNTGLNLSITDNITTKGMTKFYVETGLGFAVVDSQAVIGLKKA